ncbi:hypothetical protein [Endozoicomonas arenosclerae]|uniref:hypothetical protein n=1 Tax=Endozoicomonas arenosclerae TaxID=1633495 RepID=UPI000A6E5A2B|nr:hypothetical protein [Endozoicomonas arenosclerae]
MQGCEGAKSVDRGKSVDNAGSALPSSSPPKFLPALNIGTASSVRKVSEFSVNTVGNSPGIVQLMDDMKAGKLDQESYEQLLERLRVWVSESDQLDIWYGEAGNQYLSDIRQLKDWLSCPPTHLIDLAEEHQLFLACRLKSVQSVFLDELSGIQEETEPLIRLLTQLEVIRLPLDQEFCPVKSAVYLPPDLFRQLWGSELQPQMRSAAFGFSLLSVKPAELFNWWQSEMCKYEGVEVGGVPSFQKTMSEVIFSKMRQGDLYCKTEFAEQYCWNHFILPRLKDWHQKGQYPRFCGERVNGMHQWMSHHKKELDNIFHLLIEQPSLLPDFMAQIPKDMLPFILWCAFTQGYPEVVEAIQTACSDALSSLRAIETDTGNSLLHYLCIDKIEEGSDLLLKLIREHDLERYASLTNAQGKTPLEGQSRTYELYANGKIKQRQKLRLYGFFFEHSRPQQISACLEHLLEEEPLVDHDCIPLLILGLLAGGIIPEKALQKKRLNYSMPIWQKSEGNHALAPFLSWVKQFEPLNVDNLAALLNQLPVMGIKPEVVSEVLAVLPPDVLSDQLESYIHGEHKVWFQEQFLSTQLYPLGQGIDASYPWTSLLQTVGFRVAIPKPDSDQERDYQCCLDQHVYKDPKKLGSVPEAFTDGFKEPDGITGLYGRSLYHQGEVPGLEDTVPRIKLRKRGTDGTDEPLEELTREAGVLQFLREQQVLFKESNGRHGMDLHSKLPEPVGNFVLPDASEFLASVALSEEDRAALQSRVALDSERDTCEAYLFQTKPGELYHRYAHETSGEEGLSRENALKALRVAAHDIGVLFRNGFSVPNALPAFHTTYESDSRKYMTLNQLSGYCSQGSFNSWTGPATEYPNMSPFPVVLRDFAEIRKHSELSPVTTELGFDMENEEAVSAVAMNELANNMLALEMLLARILTKELNSRDPVGFSRASEEVENELLVLYTTLYGEAFGMPEGSPARERLRTALKDHGIASQAARELCYWCETGEHPGWVEHVQKREVPSWVYPQPLPEKQRKTFLEKRLHQLKKTGFMCSTKNPHPKLAAFSGWFLLAQSNCMKTLSIAEGIIHQNKSYPSLPSGPIS